MSDEYNHVPLKIVDHKELHPRGTAARIAELEAQIHAAVHRKMEIPPEWCTSGAPDDKPCEYEFAEAMGPLFGIKDMLAREVMYENDEGDRWHWEDDGTIVRNGVRYGETRKYRTSDTPAERWQRMRQWVVSHLKGIP